MAENGQAQSVLQLDKILFDKIEFKRLGFPADKEFEVTISASGQMFIVSHWNLKGTSRKNTI